MFESNLTNCTSTTSNDSPLGIANVIQPAKLLTTLLLIPALAVTADAEEFQSLFNGKDLSGWGGKTEFWSVKDGAIFGQTTKDKPTKGNTFLVWQGGEVDDFVFKARVRFSGNNSGVQYRSELVGDQKEFVVKGYVESVLDGPNDRLYIFGPCWFRGSASQSD